jgi:hypothetical protein
MLRRRDKLLLCVTEHRKCLGACPNILGIHTHFMTANRCARSAAGLEPLTPAFAFLGGTVLRPKTCVCGHRWLDETAIFAASICDFTVTTAAALTRPFCLAAAHFSTPNRSNGLVGVQPNVEGYDPQMTFAPPELRARHTPPDSGGRGCVNCYRPPAVGADADPRLNGFRAHQVLTAQGPRPGARGSGADAGGGRAPGFACVAACGRRRPWQGRCATAPAVRALQPQGADRGAPSKAGMSGYWTKPLAFKAFMTTLETLLGKAA